MMVEDGGKKEMEGGNRKYTLMQCPLLTLLKYWKALSMKVSKANTTNVMDLASERVCSVDGPQVTPVIIQTSAADSEAGMRTTAQTQMV